MVYNNDDAGFNGRMMQVRCGTKIKCKSPVWACVVEVRRTEKENQIWGGERNELCY